MTTIEHKTCYCGKPGLPDHYHNLVGKKGKVAYVKYCSDECKQMFNKYGDFVALFKSNTVKLKQSAQTTTRPTTTSDYDDYF